MAAAASRPVDPATVATKETAKISGGNPFAQALKNEGVDVIFMLWGGRANPEKCALINVWIARDVYSSGTMKPTMYK